MKRGHHLTFILVACLSILALLFQATPSARAYNAGPGSGGGTATASVTVTGGTLSGGNISFSNIGPVTLTGTGQTVIVPFQVTNIVDASGSGSGWRYLLSIDPFQSVDGNGNFTGQYPGGSPYLDTAPVVAAVDPSSSDASNIVVHQAYSADNTAIFSNPVVKILSAPAGQGMGSYSVTGGKIGVFINGNALVGNYRADATASLDTGP